MRGGCLSQYHVGDGCDEGNIFRAPRTGGAGVNAEDRPSCSQPKTSVFPRCECNTCEREVVRQLAVLTDTPGWSRAGTPLLCKKIDLFAEWYRRSAVGIRSYR